MFEQVTAGPGQNRRDDGIFVSIGGDHQDYYTGVAAFNLAACLDAIHLLHAYIHEDQFWIQHGHLSQGFRAITCFPDYCEVRFCFKCRAHSKAYHLVIVYNHNTCFCHTWPPYMGMRATMLVPPVGPCITSNVPPNSSARSRMPRIPWPE